MSDRAANPVRGEAELWVGEGELGSLFALVERAAEARLTLSEVAALFWHCLAERPEALTRDRVGEAVAELGLARTAPLLKGLLRQILQGAV